MYKVVLQYLSGSMNAGSGLFILDPETMEKKRLTEKTYSQPKYSPDGNYLLVGKEYRQLDSLNSWVKVVYILELGTKNRFKIGEGSQYFWKE